MLIGAPAAVKPVVAPVVALTTSRPNCSRSVPVRNAVPTARPVLVVDTCCAASDVTAILADTSATGAPGVRVALIAASFDERDPAVKFMISAAIRACKARGKYVGICGQGPSDHVDLAEWLLAEGIDSMSLNPDTVVETWTRLGQLTASA